MRDVLYYEDGLSMCITASTQMFLSFLLMFLLMYGDHYSVLYIYLGVVAANVSE